MTSYHKKGRILQTCIFNHNWLIKNIRLQHFGGCCLYITEILAVKYNPTCFRKCYQQIKSSRFNEVSKLIYCRMEIYNTSKTERKPHLSSIRNSIWFLYVLYFDAKLQIEKFSHKHYSYESHSEIYCLQLLWRINNNKNNKPSLSTKIWVAIDPQQTNWDRPNVILGRIYKEEWTFSNTRILKICRTRRSKFLNSYSKDNEIVSSSTLSKVDDKLTIN